MVNIKNLASNATGKAHEAYHLSYGWSSAGIPACRQDVCATFSANLRHKHEAPNRDEKFFIFFKIDCNFFRKNLSNITVTVDVIKDVTE
jgi:hypothetical protein